MCGVFGYVGKYRGDLSNFIISSLEKLEYRGYDSAGIAIVGKNGVKIVKEVGEVANLKKLLGKRVFGGQAGIGHTRWATHGGVTRANAHPHTDCSGQIVVVHNGIFENYLEIKRELLKKGHKFVSQTDTEVFAHLLEDEVKKQKSFYKAVYSCFQKTQGLNAFICLMDGEIVAFRNGSPLVAGVGGNGNYISSDIPALLQDTHQIIIFEDQEGVRISQTGVDLISKSGKLGKPKIKKIGLKIESASLGKYRHYMQKEIFEEAEVLARIANTKPAEIKQATEIIKKAWGIYFSACGTAAHAGLAATYLFSEIAKTHVNFAVGSEFVYFEDFLVPKSLLIAASQSGETMDTLEAVRAAKRHGSKVFSLVNVPGSTLERMSDFAINLKAGPERAVVSTKAYVAKLAYFLIFAMSLAGKTSAGIAAVRQTGSEIGKMLNTKFIKNIETLARKLRKARDIYLIGRGVNYATALEGALKIKEASYIHAEGFAGGELKHGVIALIEKGTPCIVIVANDRAREATLSNAMELKSRGALIIGIAPQNEDVFDFWIPVADVGLASPIVNVIPLQLLAYRLAVLKGRNPDKPRNLAKSVTVK